MMLCETYFYWSGVLLNAVGACFIALVLWVWFIWPFVEACSFTRCVVKGLGKERKSPLWKILAFAYADMVFGRHWTAKYTNLWRWEGVGKWQVFKDEDSE